MKCKMLTIDQVPPYFLKLRVIYFCINEAKMTEN